MEFCGKTIDSAIEIGLKELGLNKEEAIITVIEEGSKGVLGIGGKKAVVNIESKKEGTKRVINFIDTLFEKLNIPATSELSVEEEKTYINVITTASSSVIGYRGEILDAIQTLASAIMNTGNDEYKRVVVDCENYRQKREETLKNLAIRLAEKSIKNGKKVSLEPMNPFERRIIHSAISNMEGVKTESQGNEPNRYVVIVPDNLKSFDRRNAKNGKFDKKQSGFQSEMIKINKKTSGFGTFLGNSLKDK